MKGARTPRPRRRIGDILSVTLVGAEYPVNLGYVARLLKNFGVERLFLVEPRCDMAVASVYASHGSDLLDRAEMVTLKQVRRRHDLLLATTAIRVRRGANVIRSAISPEEAAMRVAGAESASLILGRDTTGLTNDELAVCDLVTTVDTGTNYMTLNVSHAAGIILYLASRAMVASTPLGTMPREDREIFSRYAYELALATGLQKHRAERLKQVAGRISLRSNLSAKEFGLLVSLLRRANLAVGRDHDTERIISSAARRPSS